MARTRARAATPQARARQPECAAARQSPASCRSTPALIPPTLAPYAPRLTSDRRARTARYQTTVPVSAAPDVVPVRVASGTNEVNLLGPTSRESPQQLEASEATLPR